MEEKRAKFLDLLNAQHTFPEPFTMKFIGHADDDFVRRVVDAVQEALDSQESPPHTIRPSADGKHVSVTVMPIVSSADQVWQVYERARAIDGMKIVL